MSVVCKIAGNPNFLLDSVSHALKTEHFTVHCLLHISHFLLQSPMQTTDLPLCILTAHYTLHSILYTLRTAHYTLQTTCCKVNNAQYTQHTTHYIQHTTNCTLHTTSVPAIHLAGSSQAAFLSPSLPSLLSTQLETTKAIHCHHQ